MIRNHSSDATEDRPGTARRADTLVLVVISTAIFLFYQPWNQPEVRDKSIWDYVAQVIADGGVPYRDAIEIKTPLAAFLGAGAIRVGRLAGAADVHSIRILFFLIALALVLAVYDLGSLLFDRTTGFLAALLVAGIDPLGEWAASGIQPKVPFTLFGVVAISLALRSRGAWAGAAAALSALCWQPGVIFLLPAAAALFPDRKQLVRLFAGFAIPLALCAAYFAAVSALTAFFNWTIVFPFGPYVAKYVRSIRSIRDTAWKLLELYYPREIPLLGIAGFGMLIGGAHIWWAEERRRAGRLLLVAILPVAIIAALTAVNLQGESDLFPLLPFAFIFTAMAAAMPLRRILSPTPAILAGSIACLAWSASDAPLYHIPSTLHDEFDALSPVAKLLGPGDAVYVHGDLQLLVLFHLRNASPQLFLDRGKDEFLDHLEPDGFRRFLDRLDQARPKVIVLGRRGMIERIDELTAWVKERYNFDRRIRLSYGPEGRFEYAMRVYVRRGEGEPPKRARSVDVAE